MPDSFPAYIFFTCLHRHAMKTGWKSGSFDLQPEVFLIQTKRDFK